MISVIDPEEMVMYLETGLEAAIGAAMREEYRAIVASGFTLQIDAPDLAMGRHIMYRDAPIVAVQDHAIA